MTNYRIFLQCLDNVRFSDFVQNAPSDASSVSMPQSVRNDPKLFQDDVDIRFSRSLNSCKVCKVRIAFYLERYANVELIRLSYRYRGLDMLRRKDY